MTSPGTQVLFLALLTEPGNASKHPLGGIVTSSFSSDFIAAHGIKHNPNMATNYQASLHSVLAMLYTLLPLTATTPTPTVAIPSALTSFPTTVIKTAWTSYSTSTQYPNPGLPLFSEQQWVDTTIAAVYEPWLSAPTSFPYTMVRISAMTAKNELRITSEWNEPASTISLRSNAWTVRETLTL